MKRLFCLCFLLNTFHSNAQLQTGTFKMLTGTIDAYPVTMLLLQQGHDYNGYYYYASTQKPIHFSGSDTTRKDSIILTAITTGDKDEYFTLSLKDNTAKGTWKRTRKQKALLVSLSEDSLSIPFSYAFLRDSILLRKNMKSSPMATFEASAVWPETDSSSAKFIKSQLKKLFNADKNITTIGSLLKAKKRNFFSDYLKENKDAKAADIKETPSFFNYDASYDLLITFETRDLISFSFSNYTFTGGAHGNYGTSYLSLNTKENKVLRLKDIMNTNGINRLQPLLENDFRKQFQLVAKDSLTKGGLFENKIKPNGNFYVTEKGISFIYNPYEIGPYVMGEIDLFISFKDLIKYLQPGFKKLISVPGNG